MKVNLTKRSSAALTILLAVAASLGLSAPAVPGAQVPHAGAQAPPETKIGASAHIEPLRPGYEFAHGQTLHYEGEWRFLPAGVATLRIERAGPQEHVTATADSIGVVALLYRVQDQFNSYLDAKSLCSYKLLKHTEEGLHRRDTAISYDYARGKAILEERNLKDNQQKKTENDIPSCVTDVLSGIFYVGSLPLQPRLVEDVVGELLVGEHGQRGAFGVGHQFGGLLHGKLLVLADDRHYHVHHHLQAAQLAAFFCLFLLLPADLPSNLFPAFR